MSWSSLPRSHFPLIILAWTSILVHFLIIIVIRKFRKRNQLYQNPYITLALAQVRITEDFKIAVSFVNETTSWVKIKDQSSPSVHSLHNALTPCRAACSASRVRAFPAVQGEYQLQTCCVRFISISVIQKATIFHIFSILLGLQTAQKSQLIIFQIPFALNLAFTAFVATLSYHKVSQSIKTAHQQHIYWLFWVHTFARQPTLDSSCVRTRIYRFWKQIEFKAFESWVRFHR